MREKNTSLYYGFGSFVLNITVNNIIGFCFVVTHRHKLHRKISRGRTNNSKKTFADFCNISHLFISNSAFQHPVHHNTAWKIQIQFNNKLVKIYNQTDYTIYQENQKHLLCNSRSYSNTLTNTDRRIVVT